MKMVTALIGRQHLKNISSRLSALGVHGKTLTEIKLPNGKAMDSQRPGIKVKYSDYVPLVKLETVVNDRNVKALTELIRSVPSDNDTIADNICVFDIIESVRIRTGEKGDSSI
jgi:nitrogen regulatory protein PII